MFIKNRKQHYPELQIISTVIYLQYKSVFHVNTSRHNRCDDEMTENHEEAQTTEIALLWVQIVESSDMNSKMTMIIMSKIIHCRILVETENIKKKKKTRWKFCMKNS